MHEHIKGTWVRQGGENYSHKTTLVHLYTQSSDQLNIQLGVFAHWDPEVGMRNNDFCYTQSTMKGIYNQWGCTTRESHCLQGTVTLYSVHVINKHLEYM